MARPKDDTWVVKLDEFHPDAGIAAKYADQEARLSTVRRLTARIRELATKERLLTVAESLELSAACERRNQVAREVSDFNDEEKED